MRRRPPQTPRALISTPPPIHQSAIPLHSVESTLERDYTNWVLIAIGLMSFGYALSGAALWFLDRNPPVTEALMVVAALVAYGLVRTGRARGASVFLVSVIWLEIVGAVLSRGSLVAYPGAPAFPVLVVLVGFLLGRGGALVMALLSIAALPLAILLGHQWLDPVRPLDIGAEGYDILVLAMTSLGAAALVHAGQSTLASLAEQGRRGELRALQLGRIVEEAAGEIFVVGLKPHEFLFVSRGACENTGYSADALLSTPVESVMPGLDEVALPDAEGGGEDKKPSPRRAVLRRRDGSAYPVELRIEAGQLGARHVVIIFAEDVTEREQAEIERAALQEQLQQAQKLDAVGLLAGGVAHDFNNLLTVIGGNADLIAMKSDGEPKALAERILKAYDQGALLTRRLLAFARQGVVRPRVLAVPDVIEDARPLLGSLLGEGVALTITSRGSGTIVADGGQVEQVLLNLAANARDAMPFGGEVRIDGDVGVARPGFFRLCVEDTGSGMAAGVLERAFEPFFTTKARGKGTGLGLSTVHGILSQNDGSVDIESAPGRGTRVTLHWPLAVEESPCDSVPTAPRHSPGDGKTILVAEDNDATRRVTYLHLESAGYQVVPAMDGDEAVRILESGLRPDLLLTDVVMPGTSGIALAERAHTEWPEVPVLMMSGYMDGERPGPGAPKDFLQKPFRRSELLDKVSVAMGSDPRR